MDLSIAYRSSAKVRVKSYITFDQSATSSTCSSKGTGFLVGIKEELKLDLFLHVLR